MTTRRGAQRTDGVRSLRTPIRRDDRGDTLIEVLMTILVVAITAVSLLLAFSGSIAGSASHRSLVAQDVALRTVAQDVYAQVAQQQDPLYQPCATYYGSASPSSQFNAPSGYTSTVAVSGYYYNNQWNATSPSDCTTPVPQQLLVTVTPTSGPSSQTTIVVSGLPTSSTAFTITSITPSSVTPGTNGQYITIAGTGFQSGAVGSFPAGSGVTFSGGSTSSPPSSPQPSSWTFLSSTAIEAQIDVASGATGPVTFTLTNPDGSTATFPLAISPGPTITAINGSANPLTLYIDDTNDPFDLTGTNFQSGAVVSITPSGVSFDSSNPSPGWTVVSPTSITTSVDVSSSANAGTYHVTVTNPDGQVSNAYPFIVAYPAPTILKVNNGDSGNTCTVKFPGKSGHVAPRLSPHDDTNVTCVVTGTNFYSPVTATLSAGNGNNNLPTISTFTVNSPTSLTLTLSNPNGYTWGGKAGPSTYNLTVTTPGGSASYSNAITVTG